MSQPTRPTDRQETNVTIQKLKKIKPANTRSIPPEEVQPGMLTADGIVLYVEPMVSRSGKVYGHSIEHRSVTYAQLLGENVLVLGSVDEAVLEAILEDTSSETP